ncbi:hypothetical protein F4679DRAFT_583061 [Xylaria curta]|nr:hypothetical protein F4679DRAFT_583061 [Xylaria curta]
MRGLYMGTGVFALAGISSASFRRWTYPDCEADNCYRVFINEQYAELAPSFCLEFLASTTIDAAAIPTPFKNCARDIHAVNSACSCVTYTSARLVPTPFTTPSQVVSLTEVLSTTKVPPKTELSSNTQLPSTSCLGSSSSLTTPASSPNPPASSVASTETKSTEKSSSSGYWSLSTVYSTATNMVTSCAPTVTDCPATLSAYLTITAIPVIVTVYPARPPSYPVWTLSGALNTSNTLTASRGTVGPTTTVPLSGGYTVPTAAAARTRFNEVVIAAGSAIAIAFLWGNKVPTDSF